MYLTKCGTALLIIGSLTASGGALQLIIHTLLVFDTVPSILAVFLTCHGTSISVLIVSAHN